MALSPTSRAEWYDAFTALTASQFGELLLEFEGLSRHIEGAGTLALQMQAAARLLVQHADTELPTRVLARLSALGKLPPGLKVARWVQQGLTWSASVPIVGFQHRERFRLPIGELYVPLAFGSWQSVDERLKGSREAHPGLDTRRPQTLYIADALADLERRVSRGSVCRGVIVVGEPGSGKTTLLRHLFHGVHTSGSASFGLSRGLTPIHLQITHLSERAVAAWQAKRQGALEEMVEAAAMRSGNPGAGRAMLSQGGPFLFLLDGLDEVTTRTDRVAVARWLAAEIGSGRWKGSRFVATCRTTSWEDRDVHTALRSLLVTLLVKRFTAPDIHRYVRAWFPLAAMEDPRPGEVQEDARQRGVAGGEVMVEALKGTGAQQVSYRLERLAGNPLLLGVICLVQYHYGRLPRDRATLYRECLGLLLTVSAEVKGIGHQRIDDQVATAALRPLAWAMHLNPSGKGDQSTELSEPEVLQHLADALGGLPDVPWEAPAFLKILREASGVLISRDVGTISFAHLTFQEYLVACHVAAGLPGRAEELVSRADDERWHEPILLAMGMSSVFGIFIEKLLLDEARIAGRERLMASCLEHARATGVDFGAFVTFLERVAATMSPPPMLPVPAPGFLARLWISLGLQAAPAPPAPPDPGPPPDAVLAVLRLFATSPPPHLQRAAEPLMDHPDERVKALAARVAGKPLPEVVAKPSEKRKVLEVAGMRLELVWVPPTKTFFWMGSTDQPGESGFDPDGYDDERPCHRVRIREGFWLGRFPVTNAQYRAYVKAAGVEEPESFVLPEFEGPDHPVAGTSWDDASGFCAWLSQQLDGDLVTLPTEAEWEWSARGEDGRKYPWGGDAPDASRAVFDESGSGHTEPVGQRPAGAGPFGAEEQAGQVWEWCLDDWSDSYAEKVRHVSDADGHVSDNWSQVLKSKKSSLKLLRGGSWRNSARNLRCADRRGSLPDDRLRSVGFRVVCRRPPSTLTIES